MQVAAFSLTSVVVRFSVFSAANKRTGEHTYTMRCIQSGGGRRRCKIQAIEPMQGACAAAAATLEGHQR